MDQYSIAMRYKELLNRLVAENGEMATFQSGSGVNANKAKKKNSNALYAFNQIKKNLRKKSYIDSNGKFVGNIKELNKEAKGLYEKFKKNHPNYKTMNKSEIDNLTNNYI